MNTNTTTEKENTMEIQHTLTTRLTNGKAATVAIIRPGQPYGRSATNDSDRTLVEFRLGWAWFQYHADTILQREHRALVLDCGQAEHTTVNAHEMQAVQDWLVKLL